MTQSPPAAKAPAAAPAATAAPAAPAAPASKAAPTAQAAPADQYDVVVIGSGPGGYIAAFRAAQNGLKTAMVEREWLGGVCTNVGCIPSKALLKNASVLRTLRDAKTFGVELGEWKADYGAAVKRSRDVVGRSNKGLEYLIKKHKVDYVQGEAKLTAKDTVSVAGKDGTKQLKTKNVVIATGARPRIFPGMEVDGQAVQHVYQLIVDERKPERLAIVGGGGDRLRDGDGVPVLRQRGNDPGGDAGALRRT